MQDCAPSSDAVYRLPKSLHQERAASTRNAVRSCIPIHRLLSEIRLVRHVAGDGGVIAEYRIFGHRLARLHGPEEIPKVRLDVVPIVTVINHVVADGLVAERRIVLCMPLTVIFVAHLLW